VLVLLALFLAGCTPLLRQVNLTRELYTLQENANAQRTTDNSLAIELTPLTYTFIHSYLTGGREELAAIIERSYYYVPMMQRVFREEGLPAELVYLPVIESGFSATALSYVRASGPWQFMAYTGRIYGLHNNWWYDERRDPEKSTRAAAKHLKALYSIFNNWNLALAAYNAGDGRISSAIRKNKTRDFWALAGIQKAIPKETRYYVPKFLAAVAIISHMQEFGINNVRLCDPLAYDTVSIPDATDLNLIAQCCGSDIASIKRLNPELKQWATPPEVTNYKLKIPVGRAQLFQDNFCRIPDDQRVTYRSYQVKSGDTLSGIAAMYHIPQDTISSFNRISDSRLIHVNDNIIIPIRGLRQDGSGAMASVHPGQSNNPGTPAGSAGAQGKIKFELTPNVYAETTPASSGSSVKKTAITKPAAISRATPARKPQTIQTQASQVKASSHKKETGKPRKKFLGLF
jgi:soluble lytic murein transglycosylase-like protein/LysM repeat protein